MIFMVNMLFAFLNIAAVVTYAITVMLGVHVFAVSVVKYS